MKKRLSRKKKVLIGAGILFLPSMFIITGGKTEKATDYSSSVQAQVSSTQSSEGEVANATPKAEENNETTTTVTPKVETNNDTSNINSTSNDSVTEKRSNITKIKHGKLLDVKVNDKNTLIIKAKIEPSMNNKLTVAQNGFNVEDIIKKQGGDKFDEIQYWAVADMTSGDEAKVISFTLNKEKINQVKKGLILGGTDLIEKSQDLWLLPSLRDYKNQ